MNINNKLGPCAGWGLAALAGIVGAYVIYKTQNPSRPRSAQPIKLFSLPRYMGKWFEVARLDNKFERNLVNVTAEYALLENGAVSVTNRGYNLKARTMSEARAIAYNAGEDGEAALKVSFFRPFYAGYYVVALDEDYQWAVVVGSTNKYFWILSRERKLPEAAKVAALEQAKKLDIDVGAINWMVE